VTGWKNVTPADPFAASFIAGIVGLFSDRVLEKLHDTINVLLPAQEDRRSDKLNAAAPAAPSVTSAQGSVTSKQMTVKGHGFPNGAVVTLNGQYRQVKFVDATELHVTLTNADMVGPVKVIVTNPGTQASSAIDTEIQA
jgi:hypothetical protein